VVGQQFECGECDHAALLVLRLVGRALPGGRGLFTVLMCAACQAARRGPPPELLADHDPGQPWLQWGCALCDLRVVRPWDLEGHTAAEHPGWVAGYEVLRPYLQQHLRVVFRQAN
jgi:hypothetical protein